MVLLLILVLGFAPHALQDQGIGWCKSGGGARTLDDRCASETQGGPVFRLDPALARVPVFPARFGVDFMGIRSPDFGGPRGWAE